MLFTLPTQVIINTDRSPLLFINVRIVEKTSVLGDKRKGYTRMPLEIG